MDMDILEEYLNEEDLGLDFTALVEEYGIEVEEEENTKEDKKNPQHDQLTEEMQEVLEEIPDVGENILPELKSRKGENRGSIPLKTIKRHLKNHGLAKTKKALRKNPKALRKLNRYIKTIERANGKSNPTE